MKKNNTQKQTVKELLRQLCSRLDNNNELSKDDLEFFELIDKDILKELPNSLLLKLKQ